MVKLVEALNQDLIIENINLFKQIPETVESWQTLYARCLIGKYITFFGYEDDKVVGVIFFSINNKNVHVAGLYGKNQVRKFIDLFYDKLKKEGYTSVTAYSKIDEKIYEKITRLKKIYSVYHTNL